MGELPTQTKELSRDSAETERKLSVERLTETTRSVLERKLRQEGEEFDETQSAEVSLREADDDEGARFAQLYLQRQDHLDGYVVLRRTVGDEGAVSYTVSRPGYEYSTLEYQWAEGGDEVKRGFSEGFYNEREGRAPSSSKQAQLPEVLSVDETADFDRMVAELNDTHFTKERERTPGKLMRKVRSGMARMALRRRQ